MTGDTVGIRRGSQVPLPLPQVLGEAPDGGEGGRIIHRNFPRGERWNARGPAVSHHLQCGDGRSGPTLEIPDGRRGWGGQ